MLSEAAGAARSAALGQLAEKYAAMRRLRDARARDLAEGKPHAPSRDELRALAARFPGVLAEIDRLSPTALRAREQEIEALRADGERPLSLWVRGWIGVHRGLRGALAIKARLVGARTIDEAMRASVLAARASEEEDDWVDRLEEIARPPNGRLVDVVMARVGEELALDGRALRALLLPAFA